MDDHGSAPDGPDEGAVPGRAARRPRPAELACDDLRSAFHHAPIGMAVTSPSGTLLGGNPALGRLLGRSLEQLTGTTLFDVTHPDDLPRARANCDAMRQGAVALVRDECRFVLGDGSEVWVSVSTSRVPASPGRPAHLIMHVEDVSARKALELELQRRALHDPLTGLANRALLLDRAGHALSRAARDGRPVTLLFLDLDGFKQVNDVHGHSAGDRVLIELARRLQLALRPSDTAARLGGDEFAVLCEDTDGPRAAVVADRLRELAAQPFDVAGAALQLGVAVGTAGTGPGRPARLAAEQAPATAAELLHLADLDMYRAKRAGRGGGPDHSATPERGGAGPGT